MAVKELVKPKKLHEHIKGALDGRTVMWLHKKIDEKIDYVELTRMVRGTVVINQAHLDILNPVLGTSLIAD